MFWDGRLVDAPTFDTSGHTNQDLGWAVKTLTTHRRRKPDDGGVHRSDAESQQLRRHPRQRRAHARRRARRPRTSGQTTTTTAAPTTTAPSTTAPTTTAASRRRHRRPTPPTPHRPPSNAGKSTPLAAAVDDREFARDAFTGVLLLAADADQPGDHACGAAASSPSRRSSSTTPSRRTTRTSRPSGNAGCKRTEAYPPSFGRQGERPAQPARGDRRDRARRIPGRSSRPAFRLQPPLGDDVRLDDAVHGLGHHRLDARRLPATGARAAATSTWSLKALRPGS